VNLKPCPFCGEDAEHIHVYQYEEIVRCPNECCFVQPSVICELPEECEELWNRRTVSGQEATWSNIYDDLIRAGIDEIRARALAAKYAAPVPATEQEKP
jgi:hypothetical protein